MLKITQLFKLAQKTFSIDSKIIQNSTTKADKIFKNLFKF